jgi:hypothetical protein
MYHLIAIELNWNRKWNFYTNLGFFYNEKGIPLAKNIVYKQEYSLPFLMDLNLTKNQEANDTLSFFF